MGVFKLPISLVEEYTKIIRDFWWGDDNNCRKIHWLAWDNMVLPKCMGGLGFRDLRLFNQALLARQAWRLIQFPDSLCARVLKARYYPSCELIDAVHQQTCSPTWRSIESGLELLKKGLVWRVGDGKKIQIWRDQWIPRESTFKPTKKGSRSRVRWVSQLFKQGEKSWDAGLINQICYPFDAEEILKIKIPQFQTEDFLAWHYEKSRLFSVRSAYRLAMSFGANSSLGSSSAGATGERSIWKKIWNAPVPQKVKVFAWRLARDGLATLCNRRKRKLEPRATCQICGTEEEDGFHADITCTRAKALRDELRASWRLPEESMLVNSGPDWLLMILQGVPGDDGAQFLLLLWRAWHLRNDCIFGKGKETVLASATFLQSYWDSQAQIKQGNATKPKGKDTFTRHAQVQMNRGPTNIRKVGWTAPPEGWVKVNTDGAFILQSREAGVGVIIRDHTGKVLISSWTLLRSCASAEEAEALALRDGIRLLVEWVRLLAILELDCANLVSGLAASARDRSPLWCTLLEVKAMLALAQDYKIVKIPCEANRVAHCLAHYAIRSKSSVVWRFQAPQCVLELLRSDCNQSSI